MFERGSKNSAINKKKLDSDPGHRGRSALLKSGMTRIGARVLYRCSQRALDKTRRAAKTFIIHRNISSSVESRTKKCVSEFDGEMKMALPVCVIRVRDLRSGPESPAYPQTLNFRKKKRPHPLSFAF